MPRITAKPKFHPRAKQFERALRRIDPPRDRRLQFLRKHYDAPGRALTARLLAERVG